MRSLSSLFEALAWLFPSPAVASGRDVAVAACRLGGDAGAGMRVVGRDVAISTVPSSPENERRRTNERTNISLRSSLPFLLSSISSFLFVFCAVLHLSFSCHLSIVFFPSIFAYIRRLLHFLTSSRNGACQAQDTAMMMHLT
jgi:hypothetical protein